MTDQSVYETGGLHKPDIIRIVPKESIKRFIATEETAFFDPYGNRIAAGTVTDELPPHPKPKNLDKLKN